MRREAIEGHYRGIWGDNYTIAEFVKGPVEDLPRDFAVLAFPPREARSMWTYATCCMSQEIDEKAVELHMFSPFQSMAIVEILFATAHYHRTVSKLDLGHSVNFGRPWLDQSQCEHGLISLPYLDGPSLENSVIGQSAAFFYWMIPITLSEVKFKKQRGLDALEAEFDRVGLNYLDPSRRSVA